MVNAAKNNWQLWNHDLFLLPEMGAVVLQGLQAGTKDQ
jgi:hypothetical protein